jgi:D-alanine-D-alanine ligase
VTRKIRVAVLFGGRSEEHEVSVVSARSVMDALDPETYDAVAIGIDRDGGWHVLPGGPPVLEPGASRLPAVEPAPGDEVSLALEPGSRELVTGTGPEPIDVVFPVLHGPFGEDGTIQGLLELAGIPYVGSGVLASAVGMDKAVQKVLFAAGGLPVVPHAAVTRKQWSEDPEAAHAAARDLGYPVFTKPSSLGSSVGISKVKTSADLDGAMDEAFRHGPKALIERAMEGAREIECAVLGNEDPVASVPGEILPASEFYDYRAKYLDQGTRLDVPADLPEETRERIQALSVAAFRAIDAAGMARVDFFVTGRDVVVNEINTIPGFTKVSMYPLLWEASGLTYPALVDRLIRLALERHQG